MIQLSEACDESDQLDGESARKPRKTQPVGHRMRPTLAHRKIPRICRRQVRKAGFKAKNPESIVRTQLRRHCSNINSPQSSHIRYTVPFRFRLTADTLT